MAVAFIQEWTTQGDDRSTTNYDAISDPLNARDDPPDGGIFHTAGWDEEAGVFRIFDVWETREHCERFLKERLRPLVEELAAASGDAGSFRPPDREAFYELHDVFP
jgi:hypothetical protein